MRLKTLDLNRAFSEKHYVSAGIAVGLVTGVALKAGSYLLTLLLHLIH